MAVVESMPPEKRTTQDFMTLPTPMIKQNQVGVKPQLRPGLTPPYPGGNVLISGEEYV